MTTVCVTGGLGFIGAPLCQALVERGYRVRCLDRLSGVYSSRRGPAAAARLARDGRIHVRVEDARVASLRGVDAVIHLAARPGVRSTLPLAELWRDNVELTELMLARAERVGARLVLASSSSVYGNAALRPTPEQVPGSPLGFYALSKLAAESACFAAARERGAHALAVRPFTVFGPGQRPDMAVARWTSALTSGQPIDWHPHPGGARELTYVDDAVRGIIAALERGRPGEAYNIGGSGSHRLEDVLALLERITGRRARVRPGPPSASEAVSTEACRAKSALELGYRPRVSLEDGLRAQAEAGSDARAPRLAA